ncbi:translation initiation factor IF-2 [Phascolarctobacterium sp.]|uniref:translation initiation factor IF-2 n=1 Tax=Phascolarctobacterium sp. TaxID=2049039 RepID=UPI0015A8D983|nr:translation initiation factor IF-2 [uncultured Phascolarctobacterium sp.]
MGKHRVYEIAKEIGKSNQEVMDILAKNNIQVKSTLSTVDDTARDLVMKNTAKKSAPEKKAAPAVQPVAPKAPVQQQAAAPQQVRTPQNPAANAQRPQQQVQQRPNKQQQGQRPASNNQQSQRPQQGQAGQQNRPQQGQYSNQNRPQQSGGQQQRPNNQQGQRPQQGQYSNQNRPQQSSGQQQRPNNQQGQRPQQGQYSNQNRPQQSGGQQQRPNNQQGQRPQQGQYSNQNRPQQSSGQQRPNNQQGNRPQQRPQGGIYIGPRGQQPGQHNTNNAPRPQGQGGTGTGQRPQGQGSANRPTGTANKPFNKNVRKNNKPAIKGSYATKDSRPNRSTNHMGRTNKRQSSNNNAPRVQQPIVEIQKPTFVEIGETINVKDFANLLKREVSEVIKSLFMLGVMVTINQDIDFDTALLVGSEFGVEVAPLPPEEDPTEIPDIDDDPEKRLPRPPVITVMGHVDHGKTSLLDAIRKANVTAREAGGITQHIGAYQVNYQGKKIVFLDTPGHEAFTAMRARGAQVTDVAILVVAADDGVMPQTLEAINHAKAAKVPIIVAINKMDRPGANPEHVKQQLSEHELIPEDWGGDTIMVPVSAHQKTGISDLLEMILLVAEMQDLKANPHLPAHGTIIEAQLDKGRGPVATVLVQRGTLQIGDTIIAGTAYGKVRAMINDRGEKVKKALPSTPVEVLGLNDVPLAGDILDSTDEKTARSVADKRVAKKRTEEIQQNSKVSLDDLFQRIQEGEIKDLNIVVKADVQGTIEALRSSLQNIKNEEVKVVVVHAGVGAITESDVMLASAANALIIGFNVRPDANARKAAEAEKVDLRTYRVIYDALNDVEAAIKGMLAPKFQETIQGRVEVRQMITISKMLIAGCYVLEGKITSASKVRVVRDGIVINEDEIDTLRRFKDDVKEVAAGYECGVTLEKFRDLKEGDVFEVFTMEEVAVE